MSTDELLGGEAVLGESSGRLRLEDGAGAGLTVGIQVIAGETTVRQSSRSWRSARQQDHFYADRVPKSG